MTVMDVDAARAEEFRPPDADDGEPKRCGRSTARCGRAAPHGRARALARPEQNVAHPLGRPVHRVAVPLHDRFAVGARGGDRHRRGDERIRAALADAGFAARTTSLEGDPFNVYYLAGETEPAECRPHASERRRAGGAGALRRGLGAGARRGLAGGGRAPQPEAERVRHVCAERALAEADAVRPGDPRPLCGVPVGIKDLLSATEGLPTTRGQPRLRRLGRRPRHRPRAAPARGGRDRRRQDEHARARPAPGDRERALRRDPQPVATRPLGRRLLGRQRGGGRRRHGRARRRQRPRRLDPHPGRPAAASSGSSPASAASRSAPTSATSPPACPSTASLTRTVLDTAVALDAIAGYEPGDRHVRPPGDPSRRRRARPGRVARPARAERTARRPGRRRADAPPRRARPTRSPTLGHDVPRATPDWDDESFPPRWDTFVTGARAAPRPRRRAPARPSGRSRLARARRPAPGSSTRAGRARRLPRGGRAAVGFARRLLRAGGRRGAGDADADAAAGAGRRMRSQAGVTDDAVRFSALVRIWNVTGQPAISLPLAIPPTASRSASSSLARPAARRSCSPSPPSSRSAVGWPPAPGHHSPDRFYNHN